MILPFESFISRLTLRAVGKNLVTSPFHVFIFGFASIVAVFFFSLAPLLVSFMILGGADNTFGLDTECGGTPGGATAGGTPGGRTNRGGGAPMIYIYIYI